MARNEPKITTAPISDGRSAATKPRKTHSESRKMIGNASISARARSSPMIEPTCSPTTATPPRETFGSFASSSPMRDAASSTASSPIGAKNAATYEDVPSSEISASPPPS